MSETADNQNGNRRGLTIHQRVAANTRMATDCRQHVWVHAHAGSGKTWLLTQRYLALLLAGTPADEILCITYTRAAAAEMANRVLEHLRHWAVCSEDELRTQLGSLVPQCDAQVVSRARNLFARAVDLPFGLQIQTIHAFCQVILERFPIEVGIPPYFRMMEEEETEEILARQHQGLAGDSLWDADCNEIERWAGISDSEREIFRSKDMLTYLHAWERVLESYPDTEAAIAHMYTVLGVAPGQREEDILATVCTLDAAEVAAWQRLGDMFSKEHNRELVKKWATAVPSARRDMLRDLCGVLFVKKPRDVAEKYKFMDNLDRCCARRDDLAKRIRALENSASQNPLEDALARFEKGLLGWRSWRIARAQEVLYRIYARLLAAFKAEKRQRGLLDFDDLIALAGRLLADETASAWVAHKLDGGISHVLLDEAQDVSAAQWQVIMALAEPFFAVRPQRWRAQAPESKGGESKGGEPGGESAQLRTLFCVGDVKQSIYRFQGADPVMTEASRARVRDLARVHKVPFREVELEVSFRTGTVILAFVDRLFATALPSVHKSFVPERASAVEIWPQIVKTQPPRKPGKGKDAASRRRPGHYEGPTLDVCEIVARRVVADIKRRLARGVRLDCRGGAVLQAADILILLPKREPMQTLLLQGLKRAGIVVAGADRLRLRQEPAVSDLLSVAAFACLPGDDLALAEVLRGPFIGMSDAALQELCGTGGGGSLWQRFCAHAAAGGGVDTARRAWLDEMIVRGARMDAFAFFSYILHGRPPVWDDEQGIDRRDVADGSGWRAVVRRLGPEALDSLEEFLHYVLDIPVSERSLREFFIRFQESARQIKRESVAAHGVQVMTIHGAKGLQAPLVYLVRNDIHNAPSWWYEHDEARPVRLYMPNRNRALSHVHAPCAEAEEAAEAAEQDRLFYVASTRAEEELVIVGYRQANRIHGSGGSGWHQRAYETLAAMEGVADTTGLWSKPFWRAPANTKVLNDDTPLRLAYRPASRPAPAESKGADAGESGAPGAGSLVSLPAWAQHPARGPLRARGGHAGRGGAGRGGAGRRRRTPLRRAGSGLAMPVKDQARHTGEVLHYLLEICAQIPQTRWQALAPLLCARRLGVSWPLASSDKENARLVAHLVARAAAIVCAPALQHIFAPGSRAEVPFIGSIPDSVSDSAGKPEAGAARRVRIRVDRLVVTDDKVLIVDFKSDARPAGVAAAIPQGYMRQLAVYRSIVQAAYPQHEVACAIVWTANGQLAPLDAALLDAVDLGAALEEGAIEQDDDMHDTTGDIGESAL